MDATSDDGFSDKTRRPVIARIALVAAATAAGVAVGLAWAMRDPVFARWVTDFGAERIVVPAALWTILFAVLIGPVLRTRQNPITRGERIALHVVQIVAAVFIITPSLHPSASDLVGVAFTLPFGVAAAVRLMRKSPIGVAAWTGAIGLLLLVLFGSGLIEPPMLMPRFRMDEAALWFVLASGVAALGEIVILCAAPAWLMPQW